MPEQMQAVVVRGLGGPEVLRLENVPVPSVGPDDVRVAVRSAAINFRDVQQRRRPVPGTVLPFTPGSDFAGDVIEVGANVGTLREGDRVFGVTVNGAYSEQVVAAASGLMEIPEGMSYDAAAVLPVAGLSASFLFSTAALEPGATVVTYAAAGGLGCFLGGFLSRAGIRSIGLTSSKEKAAIAVAAGHQETVLYTETDPVQAVLDLTAGRGADMVFDSVAGPEFARSFTMLRNEGTVVMCGRSAGVPDFQKINAELIEARRNLALREFYLATHVSDHLDELPARLGDLAAGFASDVFRVPITTYPFRDLSYAHQLIESGATVGKLVLHP